MVSEKDHFLIINITATSQKQHTSIANLLYPRHLCREVYSFRLDVCPFVCSFVRSFVISFVRSCSRSFVTFRHVRRIYLKVFG